MTELEKYIEEVGLFYERFGLPKMSGRILGYLIATPNEQVNFEEIITQLKASKGSISSNINLLLRQKLIEKYMVTGDRKSYYRFSSLKVFEMFEQKINSVGEIKKIFAKGNEINPNSKSVKNQQINELVDFYNFLETELPKMKEKWKAMKRTKNEY